MSPTSNLRVTSMAMLVGFSSVATAQDWGRLLEDQVKQRTNRYVEETVDKGLDTAAGPDRFTSIIEQAPESVVVNGYVVNNRRVAVQKELSARPPTHDELGVAIPKGARLQLETTARQIAQYHPYWRIYQYAVDMPQADLLRFFTDQGLTFDPSGHKLYFSKPAGNGKDFIDNLQGDPVEGFRIWRVPHGAPPPAR